MTLAEVQVKWSVILMDRLGPDIFSTLGLKEHVLHRARAHLRYLDKHLYGIERTLIIFDYY